MSLQHRGIHRLGYVRLAVEDLDAARRFALDTLGLIEYDAGPASPPAPEARSSQERVYLRCWHEPYAYSYVLERGAPRLVEIGFGVRDTDDLAAATARIAAAGLTAEAAGAGEVLADLGPSLAVTVPAGPTLRLFTDQAVPGYVVGQKAPDWNTPRSLRGTPAPLFLTHVGVTTPDPETAIAFLTDVLGFGISELLTTDDGDRTLSALLFRTNNGQDIAVFPGIDVRLHHVAFAKEDEVDILRDATWLRQDGVQLDLYGPTRQSYGRTFSVHFHDPCGIRYELCAGGRFSELHPQFQPVRWTEANLGKALAFYDNVENKEFFTPSL